MQKTVTVTIDPLGNPTVEANNFNGQGCTQATESLEKALSGGKAGSLKREYKPEWAKNGSQTIKQSN